MRLIVTINPQAQHKWGGYFAKILVKRHNHGLGRISLLHIIGKTQATQHREGTENCYQEGSIHRERWIPMRVIHFSKESFRTEEIRAMYFSFWKMTNVSLDHKKCEDLKEKHRIIREKQVMIKERVKEIYYH